MGNKYYIPKYQFARPIGPFMVFRPLWPVRLYDGRIAWLRKVARIRMAPFSHLPSAYPFWVYTDHSHTPKET